MRRTRLFHTVVIVGSTLLANCDKGQRPAPAKRTDASIDAAPKPPLIDAAASPPIDAAVTPPIDAGTVRPPPPPVRIMARPPEHPRIQINRDGLRRHRGKGDPFLPD